MALARIITRSHQCSRELALDLLARGYAVEIVSPDAIPNNLADLELRVDTADGDQLIAAVDAHAGARSASLDFVHHLKAPLGDFVRRPVVAPEAARRAVVMGGNADPVVGPPVNDTAAKAAALPAQAPQLVPKPAPQPHKPLPGPRLVPKESAGREIAAPGENAATHPAERAVAPLAEKAAVPPTKKAASVKAEEVATPPAEKAAAPKAEPPSFVVVEPPAIISPAPALPMAGRQPSRAASAGLWRATPIFAGVVALALFIAYGVRPAERPSTPGTQLMKHQSVLPEKSVPVTSGMPQLDGTNSGAGVDGWQSGKPQPGPNVTAAATSNKASGSNSHSAAKAQRSHNDFVAPNTITYFDRGASGKSVPHAKLTHPHATSQKQRREVIAADTVTYFDSKPPSGKANSDHK